MNVGDRVALVEDIQMNGLKVGSKGTVDAVEVGVYAALLAVRFDGLPVDGGPRDYLLRQNRFRKLTVLDLIVDALEAESLKTGGHG